MTTKTIEHPLEEVFDIQSGSTELDIAEKRSIDLVDDETYDDKDKEIEKQFEEIYDVAMDAFDAQTSDAEIIEPKYRARAQEVAAQYLNTALNAAREKSTLKQHKDKVFINKAKGGPKTVNQNLIVADRNELLKHFANRTTEVEVVDSVKD